LNVQNHAVVSQNTRNFATKKQIQMSLGFFMYVRIGNKCLKFYVKILSGCSKKANNFSGLLRGALWIAYTTSETGHITRHLLTKFHT